MALVTGERKKAELKAVLSSKAFLRAPALSKFLAYICEKHLQGEHESIREYNIAVEALNRGPDFDPARDSIVRVEAARLRKRLREYYAGEGANHELHIRLSDTGYQPHFIPKNTLLAKPESSQRPEMGQLPKPLSEAKDCTEKAEAESLTQPAGRLDIRMLRLPFFRRKWTAAVILFPLVIAMGVGIAARRGLPTAVTAPKFAAPLLSSSSTIRINVGHANDRYLDAGGNEWQGDNYFQGGTTFDRSHRVVFRSTDQVLYQTGREGNFTYAIPLKEGIYELHLHFAETRFGQDPSQGGEKARLFDVVANGDRTLLSNFDLVSDAGGANTANRRVFTDLSPGADGYLHLKFTGSRNGALLNGIEILPGVPGRMQPIRVVCDTQAAFDRNGLLWGPEILFSGGQIGVALAPVKGTEDPGLFRRYRWGHFNYAIPVADGSYKLSLKFAEPYWGQGSALEGGAYSRIFDVYCNGKALLTDFDIFKAAGGSNVAVERTFRGLKPNAQGKLMLSFVPVKDYAALFAFEIVPEM